MKHLTRLIIAIVAYLVVTGSVIAVNLTSDPNLQSNVNDGNQDNVSINNAPVDNGGFDLKIHESDGKDINLDLNGDTTVKEAGFKLPLPPAWLLWVTTFIAVIKLVFDFYVYVSSASEKHKNRDRYIMDEFWYRTIILPTFLEPMMEFINKQSIKLRALDEANGNADTYKDYLKSFKDELRCIMNSALILSATDESLYGIVSEKLDSLDDGVTYHCAIRALGKSVISDDKYEKLSVTESKYYEVMRDIITQFIHQHRALFK